MCSMAEVGFKYQKKPFHLVYGCFVSWTKVLIHVEIASDRLTKNAVQWYLQLAHPVQWFLLLLSPTGARSAQFCLSCLLSLSPCSEEIRPSISAR